MAMKFVEGQTITLGGAGLQIPPLPKPGMLMCISDTGEEESGEERGSAWIYGSSG